MKKEEKVIRKKLKFSDEGQYNLSAIEEMQKNLEYLSEAAMPPKYIQEMIRANERLIQSMQPSIDAAALVRPLIEDTAIKQMIGLSDRLAATRAMIQATGIQQFKEMANALNAQVNASTAGIRALGSVLENLRENEKQYSSFKEMAYSLGDITEEEIQDFEKLDNVKTKEDIYELEIIVEENKNSEKPSNLLFIYIFQILLFLYALNSSQSDNLNIEINNSQNVNVQIVQNNENNGSSFFQERILALLDYVIATAVTVGATKAVSYIKKEPNSKSDNLLKLDKGEEVNITGDERYYYKVEYYNENNELVEGFVAKRNIKTLEEIDTNK